MNLYRQSSVCLIAWLAASAASLGALPAYDIRDYGARGDGQTLCTAAIQKAIDACAAAGGGTVWFPAGTWLSGTLHLRSHVTLWLDAGCTLRGSTDLRDYPEHEPKVRSYTDQYVCQSLIAGEDLEHVAIRGQGVLDGNGASFRWKQYRNRPYVIRLVHCRDVSVEGITLRDSPMWMQHYLACDRLAIRGIRVSNHVSYNNDGLDVDGCRDVTISDCRLDSDDDALCLKSTLDRPCENVTITNCILSSHCNAFKTGTESNGGFQNITLSNCVIQPPRDFGVFYGRKGGLAGIALEIVDGGQLDQVSISNVVIDGVGVPLFLRLGNRARPFTPDGPQPGVGTFRNVSISHVTARGASTIGCPITGLPGHCIENVTLSDIRMRFPGGEAKKLVSKEVPELESKYPESRMFGELPAYGLYCRHVRGLKCSGLALGTEQPDQRHAVVCDDVQDLAIDSLDAEVHREAAGALRFRDVQRAVVRGCRVDGGPIACFLRLEGPQSGEICLMNNVLGSVRSFVDRAAEVSPSAVTEMTNLLK